MKFFQDQARRLLVMLASVSLLSLVYYAGWLKPAEHWIATVAQPIMSLAYATIDSFSPLYSTTDSALLTENRTMKDQLASVIQQNHALSVQLQQYQDYAAALAFAQEKNYTIIPAKIITRVGDSSIGQWLFISLGAADGMAVGYPVVYGPGLLLGTISIVHESYSEVKLITNDDSSVQGQTETSAASDGLLIGQFGTGLVMQYIVKEDVVAVGDVIVTNGHDQFIPAGLIIGTIQQVNDLPSELFKSANVSPMVRYGNNAIVSVVIPTEL